MPDLYTHPDIRKMTAEKYMDRLEFLRAERVLLSQEFLDKQKSKIVSDGNKAADKWNKAITRTENRLKKMAELADLVKKELDNLVTLEGEMQAAEKVMDND